MIKNNFIHSLTLFRCFSLLDKLHTALIKYETKTIRNLFTFFQITIALLFFLSLCFFAFDIKKLFNTSLMPTMTREMKIPYFIHSKIRNVCHCCCCFCRLNFTILIVAFFHLIVCDGGCEKSLSQWRCICAMFYCEKKGSKEKKNPSEAISFEKYFSQIAEQKNFHKNYVYRSSTDNFHNTIQTSAAGNWPKLMSEINFLYVGKKWRTKKNLFFLLLEHAMRDFSFHHFQFSDDNWTLAWLCDASIGMAHFERNFEYEFISWET